MNDETGPLHCPDCGSPLSSEAWGENLCLVCLLRLAAPTVSEETAVTMPGLTPASDPGPAVDGKTDVPTDSQSSATAAFEFSRGEVLADRYRVLKRLGRGGMGEVWRAYDLKLRVDVALKSLNAALAGEHGIELMRGEVRTAREVISPNVCRIFDLIEVDGHELVSMEYVDGHTLFRTLDERGPFDLQEAADVGSQLLAGLEAIHTAGLVHRDIKPENIMLTRARRVVIMDFGLTARSGEGLHAGTPAYMPPEQRQGEGTDARADVFSAGIVLAEMLSVGGDAADVIRHALWEAVRETPPSLPDIPWRRILLKAIAADREERYESAAAMARTLEKVAIRVDDAEDKTPYPGLAAYTADSAEFFFGREAEVEALWKKLQHAHLLCLVGPSGAGKSSFVNAGLLPAGPKGWSHLQMKPRQSPFAALAGALAPALQHDREALAHLEAPDDPDSMFAAVAAWRQQHREALLIVDQFEELFTQNDASTQTAFADLLARIAIDGDVHVLLSMRDDFLIRCNALPSLAPVFSELTPLRPPFGSALRRAIVHPALKCGYRFENEAIVEEMLAEVTRERAALPLIAFTAARLWDERERDTGLLTQEAYDRLGGVAGALAQHAELALEAIGKERISIVREMFRNLVTAQGTRATAEFDELLSLFHEDDREQEAGEVLQALIDARLLTSYEVRTKAGDAPARRVEVVHESLLSAWPRLVRWQSQDAENLQLRDELRQAAKMWDSRGRSDDLLWMGTAYREFRLWRERYPGRLTAVEEAFVTSMTTAGERARRRRQRILTGVIAVLLVVVAGVTTLWLQSEADRRRAQAQTVVARGQTKIESYPTGALAWALRSLEISDTLEGRLLALEALWQGPPAWQVNDYPGMSAQFSVDGKRLLQSTRRSATGKLLNMVRADGSSTLIEGKHDGELISAFWARGDVDIFLTLGPSADGRGLSYGAGSASAERMFAVDTLPFVSDYLPKWNTDLTGIVRIADEGTVRLTTFDGTLPRTLGTLSGPAPRAMTADATWLAQVVEGRVETVVIGIDGLARPRVIGRHLGASQITVNARGDLIATRDNGGEIRIWDVAELDPVGSPAGPLTAQGPPGLGRLMSSVDGSLLTLEVREPGRTEPGETLWGVSLADGPPRLRRLGDQRTNDIPLLDDAHKQVAAPTGGSLLWYRMAAPDGTQGLMLQSGMSREVHNASFHPDGDWIAGVLNRLTAWSLARPYPMIIPVLGGDVVFGPQGNEMVATSSSADGQRGIYSWPLEGAVPGARRLISERSAQMEMSPDGRTFALGGRPGNRTSPLLVRRDDASERLLEDGFADQMSASAFSPDGKLLAGVGGQFAQEENVIKVWNLETGELVAEHDPDGLLWYLDLTFAGNRQIVWAGEHGTYLWDLDLDEHHLIDAREFTHVSVSVGEGGRRLVGQESKTRALFSFDLTAEFTTELTTFGRDVWAFTLSPDGEALATVDFDGLVRVGSPTNAEPHRLYSHTGQPTSIAIDPLRRWVATTSNEEIRLWPMPDLSQPPLHTLPYNELLAKLRSLTNIRLVEDPDTAEGWSLTFEPFPGWESTPIW